MNLNFRMVKIFLIMFCFGAFSCKENKHKIETENAKEQVKQPNIVILLCDVLGYGNLSSFGHPIIETPNFDKLASSGIKLTNFYSSAPVCSPSRVGLLNDLCMTNRLKRFY